MLKSLMTVTTALELLFSFSSFFPSLWHYCKFLFFFLQSLIVGIKNMYAPCFSRSNLHMQVLFRSSNVHMRRRVRLATEVPTSIPTVAHYLQIEWLKRVFAQVLIRTVVPLMTRLCWGTANASQAADTHKPAPKGLITKQMSKSAAF